MRYAIERMSRELREVRRQTTDAHFSDITSMTASSIAFFKTDGHSRHHRRDRETSSICPIQR
jgi:hypothetical protein